MQKKIMKIVLSVLICAAVLIACLYINGTCTYKNHTADESALHWMKELSDDTLINEIAIPGSHDSGTFGMLWPGRTQNYDIEEQLSFGARYLDLRVNKTSGGYQMFHSIFNGADFSGVLSDIKTFIIENPSEFLILDFQHFKGGSSPDVFEMLESELADSGLVVRNDTSLSDVEFIGNLTLGEVRGKCIVFFGETYEDSSDWIFLRNDDTCTRDDMSLDSYYIGSLHKSGYSTLVSEAHPIYFERLEENQKNNADGIFVLQCQLTDGKFVFGPWSVERGQRSEMDEYVRNLKDSPYIESINVVMRDFLTPDICADIIDLNGYK